MIGASTGYFRETAALGYSPDFTINSPEVPAVRPVISLEAVGLAQIFHEKL